MGQMKSLPMTVFNDDCFSSGTPVLSPSEAPDLSALWCYSASEVFSVTLGAMNRKLNSDSGYVLKMLIYVSRWRKSCLHFSAGLTKAHSDDPTAWIFLGDPCGSFGLRPPPQEHESGASADRRVSPAGSHGPTGRLPLAGGEGRRDGTADEQREWVRRCDALTGLADEYGTVYIWPVTVEASAAERLLKCLTAAFGDAWSEAVHTKLLTEGDARTLDDWLRHRFFKQHRKLFPDRPFVWHIWDGRRDGFHASVDYHKLAASNGRQLLESLDVQLFRRLDYVPAGPGDAR